MPGVPPVAIRLFVVGAIAAALLWLVAVGIKSLYDAAMESPEGQAQAPAPSAQAAPASAARPAAAAQRPARPAAAQSSAPAPEAQSADRKPLKIPQLYID